MGNVTRGRASWRDLSENGIHHGGRWHRSRACQDLAMVAGVPLRGGVGFIWGCLENSAGACAVRVRARSLFGRGVALSRHSMPLSRIFAGWAVCPYPFVPFVLLWGVLEGGYAVGVGASFALPHNSKRGGSGNLWKNVGEWWRVPSVPTLAAFPLTPGGLAPSVTLALSHRGGVGGG